VQILQEVDSVIRQQHATSYRRTAVEYRNV